MLDARLARFLLLCLAFAAMPLGGAAAMSMKECSVKYKAAQAAGEVLGWKDFRKANCGAAPPADGADGADGDAATTETVAGDAESGNSGSAGASVPALEHKAADLSFPTAIAGKFAGEKPSQGRMHTCLEEYHALKKADRLGGTRWIEKGGGYYKLCNARLKDKQKADAAPDAG